MPLTPDIIPEDSLIYVLLYMDCENLNPRHPVLGPIRAHIEQQKATNTETYPYNFNDGIIAAVLQTDEGRAALAQAMVEPIRRSLQYLGIGRRLLMVEELPPGAVANYEQSQSPVVEGAGAIG